MKQFVTFCIVGLSNTILSYFLYLVFLNSFLRLNIFSHNDYIISSVLSFVLSVLWSFYWNNKYTFADKDGEKRGWIRALIRTYISYGFSGIVLMNIMLLVLVDKKGVSKEIAPLFCLLVTTPINFVLNKFWAFKR